MIKHSKQTLAKLGEEVLRLHPKLGESLIESISLQIQDETYLTKEILIADLILYAKSVGLNKDDLVGVICKSSLTEKRKVFICIISKVYGRKWSFNQTLSKVVKISPQLISRILSEVEFRYRKDEDFRDMCNEGFVALNKNIN